MLIAAGLPPGTIPDEWNLTRPEEVSRVHRAYLDAGSDVITTNTFGSTPSRLHIQGLGEALERINRAGVRLAREAVGEHGRRQEEARSAGAPAERQRGPQRLIALSLGPTGKMLPPVGQASEAEMRAEYAAQLRSLEGDFDLVLLETMYDLREALVALEAAKEILDRPVAVCLTYNRNPRGFFTVMGNEAGAAARELERAGADVIGANCSVSSRDMIDLAGVLRRATDRPILCQPNAGAPRMEKGMPVYDQTPEEFAEDGLRLFELGVNAVGGCCGTTPEFIRRVRERIGSGPQSGIHPGTGKRIH